MRTRWAAGVAAAAAALQLAASANAAPIGWVTQGSAEMGTQKKLTAVDLATGKATGSVALSATPTDVAIDPSATRAYVSTLAGVTVVNLRTRKVVKDIAVKGAGGD